jgi:predicted esterase
MSDRDSFDQLRDKLGSLYAAGDYTVARELVEKNEPNFPDKLARTTLWKMCLLSLEGRLEAAMSTFRQGLDNGLWWAESQFIDTDLDSLRELPKFQELVLESVQRWDEERKHIKREHILLLPDAATERPCPLIIALHGHNANKETDLERWDAARRLGWAVLSAQSTQPLFPGSYCWDDPVTGLQDILFSLERTLEANDIDRERILIGGFSQGSGMAIYAALSGAVPVRGFITSAAWWGEVESLAALAGGAKRMRGYFVSGEKDHTLGRAREIQDVLKRNNIPFAEELYPGLGHAFPADFEQSFIRAFEFIFKE